MDYRHLSVWIVASWLCLECKGLQFQEDLKYSETENGSLLNLTEDSTFNETESVITYVVPGNVTDVTISHRILEETTENVETRHAETKHHVGLVPMAVGGLALSSGLVFLAVVVGFFMYCNRNTEYAYENASASEPIIDI